MTPIFSAKAEPRSRRVLTTACPRDDPRTGWKLQAVRDGDEWVLNGRKRYIANGSVAKLFFIDGDPPGRTHHAGHHALPGADGYAGLSRGQGVRQDRLAFYQNAELIFEDARVPHANVVGEVNRGIQARKG